MFKVTAGLNSAVEFGHRSFGQVYKVCADVDGTGGRQKSSLVDPFLKHARRPSSQNVVLHNHRIDEYSGRLRRA